MWALAKWTHMVAQEPCSSWPWNTHPASGSCWSPYALGLLKTVFCLHFRSTVWISTLTRSAKCLLWLNVRKPEEKSPWLPPYACLALKHKVDFPLIKSLMVLLMIFAVFLLRYKMQAIWLKGWYNFDIVIKS